MRKVILDKYDTSIVKAPFKTIEVGEVEIPDGKIDNWTCDEIKIAVARQGKFGFVQFFSCRKDGTLTAVVWDKMSDYHDFCDKC